jgi:REP element-mobilizing transposase RayT
MPKGARKKSESGIYHIVLRGINKQTLFYDEEDREVFLNRLKLLADDKKIEVYAFCLMGNHIHLLIKEAGISIGKVFMMLLSSYVLWYNRKYSRIGNLFQDRYRCEGIESDAHLLCAIRYIHQNPVKAGMVERIADYKWSSHSAYIKNIKSFINTDFMLSILCGVAEYEKFINEEEQNKFLENDNKITISDEKLAMEINRIMKLKNPSMYDLLKCERSEIDDVIATVRQTVLGASIRQISRVTGISVSIVRYIE